MPKYSVRIAPSAIHDIEAIADFYLEMVDEVSAAKSGDNLITTLICLDTFTESSAYSDKTLN